MFLVFSFSSDLEFWSETILQHMKTLKFLGEISNDGLNNLLRTNVYKTLDNHHCWQYYNDKILFQWFVSEEHFPQFYL